jgi:hypothetical protein
MNYSTGCAMSWQRQKENRHPRLVLHLAAGLQAQAVDERKQKPAKTSTHLVRAVKLHPTEQGQVLVQKQLGGFVTALHSVHARESPFKTGSYSLTSAKLRRRIHRHARDSGQHGGIDGWSQGRGQPRRSAVYPHAELPLDLE